MDATTYPILAYRVHKCSAKIILRTHSASVQVLGKEVSRVDVNDQRTVGFRVTSWFVDIANERLSRWSRTLQQRQDSHVRTVKYVRGYVDFRENFVE